MWWVSLVVFLMLDPTSSKPQNFILKNQHMDLLPPLPFFLSLHPGRPRGYITADSLPRQYLGAPGVSVYIGNDVPTRGNSIPSSGNNVPTSGETVPFQSQSNFVPPETTAAKKEIVNSTPSSEVTSDITFALSQSLLDFTLNLDMAQPSADSNSVFSPFSIVSILNLMMRGAKDMSYLQLRRALQYIAPVDERIIHQQYRQNLDSALDENSGVTVTIANRIFAQRGLTFKESYLNDAEQYYNTDVESLNFASSLKPAYIDINRWVRMNTNNKITQLLDRPLPTDTKMVAVNTIYFNGSWDVPFDPNQTVTRTFTVSPSESINVDMMIEMLTIPYGESAEYGLKIIGLPYKNKKFAMFVILPDEKSIDGLNNLEAKLSSVVIETLINSMTKEEVAINLPRFKIEQKMYIKDILQNMGVRDLFSPINANLGRMVNLKEEEQLYVNDIVHQAVVEVTERGTEASAATSTSFLRDRFAKSFHADHPFLFFIRDNNSHSTLFWGKVVRP